MNVIKILMRLTFFAVFSIMLLVSWKQDPEKSDYIAVTVNILKSVPDSNFVHPEIKFASDSEGCVIRNEDGWTSETPSEFYFTVNVPLRNDREKAMLQL